MKEIRESSGQDSEKGLLADKGEAVEVKCNSSQNVVVKESGSIYKAERTLSANTSEVFQTLSLQNDEGVVDGREHLEERDSDEEKARRKRRKNEGRSRSRSRSRSRERRHKHKKIKHKHKKKKYRSREESGESDRYEDYSSDEWVEKT